MKKQKRTSQEKGITLVALIITIIVLLILAVVAIRAVSNDGIISHAKNAQTRYKQEQAKEQAMLESYLDKIVEIPIEETQKDTMLSKETNSVTFDKYGNKIVVPAGFKILVDNTTGYTANDISVTKGVVIQDSNGNEFVWIPVGTEFVNTYPASSRLEPTTISPDTQSNLNKYYGTKADGSNYYTLETDFDYDSHYSEMVASVNKYKGFYIGRYETTIDEAGNIGSKANTTVLTSDAILKDGENANDSNKPFYYRWWGLYDAQRKANVAGNGNTVQTNMIWGQQRDAMITYFEDGSKDYSRTTVATLATEKKVVKSGEAKYTYNGETISDEICNIYDLRRNTYEWVARSANGVHRTVLGGSYGSNSALTSGYASSPASTTSIPFYDGTPSGRTGSRLALYIK